MIDYAIIDFENRQNLYVAYETRDVGVAESYVKDKQGGDCEVYFETESRGKLYRVICVKGKVESDAPLRTAR
jgi:hypothetical protein